MNKQTPALVREIGEEIRASRKRQNATLRDMADKTGFGTRFISEVERGKPTAEIGRVITLLKAVGCDLSIKGTQDEPQRP